MLALRLANAQFFELLSHPERCLPLLRFFNQDFQRTSERRIQITLNT